MAWYWIVAIVLGCLLAWALTSAIFNNYTSLDETESLLIGVLFPVTFQKFKNILEQNKTYLVTYKVENREEKIQAIIDSIYNLN